MILGYLLLDVGGTLLISREYMPLFGDKEILFSGIMTAVSQALKEVVKEYIKHIETERYHLYFRFSKDFIIVIISDVRDDRIFSLMDNIVTELVETKIDSDDIRFSASIQKKISKIIDEKINRHPPPIATIEKLTNQLIAFIDNISGGEELKIEEISIEEPKGFDEREKQRIKTIVGRIPMEDLIKYYLDGKIADIIRVAPRAFHEGDLVKIIYSKAALMLNSFDPKVQSVPLDYLRSVIQSIDDKIARQYLMLELKSFLFLGDYVNKRKFLLMKQNEILSKVNNNTLEAEVYSIMVTPTPAPLLLNALFRKYRNKSKFMSTQLFEEKVLLEILTKKPKNFGEWSHRVGEIKNEINKNKDDPFVFSHYFHILQFIYVWGLFIDGLELEDYLNIMLELLKNTEKYYRQLEGKDIRVPNRIRSVNYYLTYNVILGIILDILDSNDAKKMAGRYKDRIIKAIRWLVYVANRGRIVVDMYYVSIAGLLAALSKAMFALGSFIKNMPYLIKSLISEKLELMWGYNEYHYAHLFMDLLTCIGNTALFLNLEVAKKTILLEVAKNMEIIYDIFSDTPLIGGLAALNAIKFYLLSGTEKGKKYAEKLIEKVDKKYPKFFKEISEKIVGIKEKVSDKMPFDIFL